MDFGVVRKSILRARDVIPVFGRQPTTTGDTVRLLQRHGVSTVLEDLPLKYAAMISPLLFGYGRVLSLARHVPHLGRRLVQLHEAGHLYQRTAELGITYDHDDWRTPAELGADAFAAVALCPTIAVDLALETNIWARDVEDDVAAVLMDFAEGMWEPARAIAAARHRLLVRERMGI